MNVNDKELIDRLKENVKWDMDWRSAKERAFGPDDKILQKPDIEVMFDDELALATLLADGVIFLNNHWWMEEEGWPEAACKMASLNVNTNDVLAWGCADAEGITYDELRDVYDHWEKDYDWGIAVWCCKRNNMMPQPPIAEYIRKAGIWDIDNMGLRMNPADKRYRDE